MTDILLVYEHRIREIENCALIGAELERRGYKVRLKNIYSPFKYFVKPKVVIVPHLYNNEQLLQFCKNFWLSNRCILDLQYEQILARDVTPEDIHYPKEQAVFAHHIAWGNIQVKRYMDGGIPKDNIHKTGFIANDMLRLTFRSYFKSKEELSIEFGTHPQKEWILFVSSFSYANRTEAELIQYEKMEPLTRPLAKLSNETYIIMLNWLQKAAKRYPEKQFIYRPHPAEKYDQRLYELEKNTPNLKCIREYSMRQWAIVADKTYNWYSSSLSDLFYAGKSCFIVRPLEIPKYLDGEMFDSMPKIKTEEDFLDSITKTGTYPKEVVSNIIETFGVTEGRMAYLNIADIVEGFIKEKINGHDFDYGSRWNINNMDSIGKLLFGYFKIFAFLFCNMFKIKKMTILSPKWQKTLSLYSADIYGAQSEYKQYKLRFKPIVEKIASQNG